MLQYSGAHIFDAVKIISDVAGCKLDVKPIDEGRVEAIGKSLASYDDTLFDIELYVHKSPCKFVLELVFEVRCLTKPPFPLGVAFKNVDKLWDFEQFVPFEELAIDLHFSLFSRPFLDEFVFYRCTERFMRNIRDNLL